MIIYREHRGSLKDSLETTKSYRSLLELYQEIGFHSIKYYGYDDRVKQELFMVIKDLSAVGFICVDNEDTLQKFLKENRNKTVNLLDLFEIIDIEKVLTFEEAMLFKCTWVESIVYLMHGIRFKCLFKMTKDYINKSISEEEFEEVKQEAKIAYKELYSNAINDGTLDVNWNTININKPKFFAAMTALELIVQINSNIKEIAHRVAKTKAHEGTAEFDTKIYNATLNKFIDELINYFEKGKI